MKNIKITFNNKSYKYVRLNNLHHKKIFFRILKLKYIKFEYLFEKRNF